MAVLPSLLTLWDARKRPICWVSPAGTGRYVRPDSIEDGGGADA